VRRVIVESPYAGHTQRVIGRNVRYLGACLRDSLLRGEAPFASHGLYTLPGVLDDSDAAERKLGITAGFAWRPAAEATVVYDDYGITEGMRLGIEHARELGQLIEVRQLYERAAVAK
jgi:hypothetical protein